MLVNVYHTHEKQGLPNCVHDCAFCDWFELMGVVQINADKATSSSSEATE